MLVMNVQTPYLIGLSMVPGIGPARMRLLLDHFGQPEGAWQATYADLVDVGLDRKTADALVETRRTLDLEGQLERIEKGGFRTLTWLDDAYPERLREVADSPPVLYVLVDDSYRRRLRHTGVVFHCVHA